MMRNELRGITGKVYLLKAFGLVDGSGNALRGSDPKVKAFYEEVQAGYMKYFGELMQKAVKGE